MDNLFERMLEENCLNYHESYNHIENYIDRLLDEENTQDYYDLERVYRFEK